MDKKINDIVVFILLVLLVGALAGFCMQSYRLEQTRRQLDAIRVEYAAATSRQSELAEILRRDGEILCESSTTINGIRSQIAAIRESYEAMEKLLLSSSTNSLHNNSNNNNTIEE